MIDTNPLRGNVTSGCKTVAFASMLFIVTSVAQAAPIFNAGVEIQGASFCTTGAPNCKQGADSPVPTSASVAVDSFPWSTSASASSGPGSISTSTAASTTGGAGGFAQSRAAPFFRLDDLVLTRLPGFPALPDTAIVGFDLAIDYQSNQTGFAGGNTLFVRGGINNSSQSLGTFLASADTTVTRNRTITVGVPFFIEIGIDVNSAVSTSLADSAVAMTSLTLDPFAIFNLPTGYTVSGASGLIENNSFAGVPKEVPEPGVLALFGFGLAGLVFSRRRIG